MCLNDTDKRMCLLTFANSEKKSVGCSVSVALFFVSGPEAAADVDMCHGNQLVLIFHLLSKKGE